jgi:uncharacterized protein
MAGTLMPSNPTAGSAGPEPPHRTVLPFCLLVFLFSMPFFLLGAATGATIIPGLPIAALMAPCPALAAAVLIYRAAGPGGIFALLARSFDYRRIETKRWLPAALIPAPAAAWLAFAATHGFGATLPHLELSPRIVLVMVPAFFAGAFGEELGWSGYMLEPLQNRYGALPAALLIGIVWAVWHFVPLMQIHRPAQWIAWWTLATVATRVIMVWLYNNSGKSVFAVALFHAMGNLCVFAAPAYYDPRAMALIFSGLATIIVLAWGLRGLARPPASPSL